MIDRQEVMEVAREFGLTPQVIEKDYVLGWMLAGIAEWIYEQTGIEVPRDTIRFEFYENPRGHLAGQGRVGYRGPMRRGGDAPLGVRRPWGPPGTFGRLWKSFDSRPPTACALIWNIATKRGALAKGSLSLIHCAVPRKAISCFMP